MVSSETVQMVDQLYPKGVASPDEVLNLITSLGRSTYNHSRTVRTLLQLCDVVLFAPVAEVNMPEVVQGSLLQGVKTETAEEESLDDLDSKYPLLTFMVNLAKQYPVLTHPQQCELARRHREYHDPTALQQLVVHNLRLVFWAVTRRNNPQLDYQDAAQSGLMGLMRAAERYDERLGTRFSTYAYWWIMQYMQRAEDFEARLVRRPVHVEEQIRQYKAAIHAYQEQQERDPTDAEMASMLDWNQKKVVEHRQLAHEEYVTELVSSENDEYVETIWDTDVCADQTTPEMLIAQKEEYRMLVRTTHARLHSLLSGKKKRDRDIFLARYGLDRPCLSPRTLDDVGDTFGLTRERIRQIVMKIWKSGGEQWRNIMTETEEALEKIPVLKELVEG